MNIREVQEERMLGGEESSNHPIYWYAFAMPRNSDRWHNASTSQRFGESQ